LVRLFLAAALLGHPAAGAEFFHTAGLVVHAKRPPSPSLAGIRLAQGRRKVATDGNRQPNSAHAPLRRPRAYSLEHGGADEEFRARRPAGPRQLSTTRAHPRESVAGVHVARAPKTVCDRRGKVLSGPMAARRRQTRKLVG